MFSGRLLSFVALISIGAGVGCAGVTQKPGGQTTAATGAGGTGLGGGSDARPNIDGIIVITTNVRQRDGGQRRAVRRRQQDAGRRLQRHLPDPRGLELHGLAQRLHDGGRVR